MKISTRYALTKVMWRHNALKLRVHYPALHKAMTAMVVLVICSGLVAGYFGASALFTENAPVVAGENTQIKAYSFNGEITSITDKELSVRANLVKSESGSSKVSYEIKRVLVTESTLITKVRIQDGRVTTEHGVFSDLSASRSLAIYTSVNPSDSSFLHADRIELIEI
jgi:hypothetical protein